MATTPFGPVLEAALKRDVQGGRLSLCKDFVVEPRFFCCMSGRDGAGDPVWDIGVTKAPVAVLIVSPTRACAGDVVNADYSHSWSPFGTINSWSVDWGDGQVSNGAWPGAGNVDHPLGGYALPGTYTITLTVTDLLGATGTAEQQVEIIDCTVDDLEAFAGCGGSGVWHTANGGLSWEERGGGVLEGVVVHDLKIHPFTLGTSVFELWAATAKGLYKSVDSAASWERVVLPDPDGGDDEPTAASIVCSTVEPDEVYVLAYKTVPSNRVWLYRTTDKGETWTVVGLSGGVPVRETVAVGTSDEQGHKFAIHGGKLYFCAAAGAYERQADGTWVNIGGQCGTSSPRTYGITGGGTCLWTCGAGVGAGEPHLRRWDGVNWFTVGTGDRATDVITLANGNILTCYNLYTPNTANEWTQAGVFVQLSNLGYRGVRHLIESGGVIFAGGANPTPAFGWIQHEVAQHNWADEWIDSAPYGGFTEHGGTLYCAVAATRLLIRVGGVFQWDSVTCSDTIRCAWSHGDSLYVGAGNKIYQHTATGYVPVGSFPSGNTVQRIINFGGEWFAYCTGTAGGVYRLDEVIDLTVSGTGRTHLTSMDVNGRFVHVGLLDASGNPVIVRVVYDLSALAFIYTPGAGSWGGVRVDPNLANRIWIFGDFGATSKVLYSDDWGDNWTDVTDGSWAANEVVRPVLPSVYDPSDVIAILNTALDAWHTGDTGAVWTKTGDIAFACHCGERDWMEERNLFIGRLAAGASHLQFSPNRGVGWIERSGGFQPNAPVTALQIVS